MKIVVAPDSFAGTLSAAGAAEAIAAGWRSVRPDDELVLVPMSDGGDGLIDVVGAAVAQATRHEVEVLDARGRAVTAAWLALPDGRALIESAQACGLARLAASERDPATATSSGVGQLLLAARAAGHDELVVGLGGSATMDGGAGAVVALGHRLERGAVELVRVERGAPLGASVVLAADVDSPLLGPDGAARFARQKGATDEQLPDARAHPRALRRRRRARSGRRPLARSPRCRRRRRARLRPRRVLRRAARAGSAARRRAGRAGAEARRRVDRRHGRRGARRPDRAPARFRPSCSASPAGEA